MNKNSFCFKDGNTGELRLGSWYLRAGYMREIEEAESTFHLKVCMTVCMKAWDLMSEALFVSAVTLGKALFLSMPQIPDLQSESNDTDPGCFLKLL